MGSHRDLDAWREAIKLATDVYGATEPFPASEKFGLVLQMRRCSISIASNIAEGAARGTSRDFAHFLSISLGSLAELDTQIEIASSLGYLGSPLTLQQQRASVARLVTRLRQSISERGRRSPITDH